MSTLSLLVRYRLSFSQGFAVMLLALASNDAQDGGALSAHPWNLEVRWSRGADKQGP